MPDRDGMRRSLALLEEALAWHATRMPLRNAADQPAVALRRSVEMLEEEAQRLRLMLQD